MFAINLKQYFKYLKDYTELRLQQNTVSGVSLLKGDMTVNSYSSAGGASARVYKNGYWGFASTPEVSSEKIRNLINDASGNAEFFSGKSKSEKKQMTPHKSETENDLTEGIETSQKEIIEFVKALDNYILKKCPDIESRTVSAWCLDIEKTVITSDGSYGYSLIPRSNITIVLSAKDLHRSPIEIYHPFGGLGRFGKNFENPADLYSEIDRLYEHLSKKRSAVYPSSGVQECVLDSHLAGILSHEAVGHTVEADMVLSGSVASDSIDSQVASPLITMIDFANDFKGKTCPCPVYSDDEGVEARDAVLIEKGILKGFMNNRETAMELGVEPTGNARAFRFSDEPLIRMRNTAVLPGKSKLADMISSVKNGYYLITPSNGQADSTGEFMFGITLGYEIKNGRITNAIKDTTISGIAFDMLKTVTAVSDDMLWETSGMCGKKQSIPVGMGGPALKCKVYIGGR